MITAFKGLLNNLILTSHMTISSCLQIHWLTKLQCLLNSLWTKIKQFLHHLSYLTISSLHV